MKALRGLVVVVVPQRFIKGSRVLVYLILEGPLGIPILGIKTCIGDRGIRGGVIFLAEEFVHKAWPGLELIGDRYEDLITRVR